jgi:hypothetical protein
MKTQPISSDSQFFPAVNFEVDSSRVNLAAERIREARAKHRTSKGIYIAFKNLQQVHSDGKKATVPKQDLHSSFRATQELDFLNAEAVECKSVFQQGRLLLRRLFPARMSKKHLQKQETLHEDQ